jgi:murein DD-endopeptidase MepM/ murein hydrolase activator NlpD
LSSPAYRGRHRAPAGRHRAATALSTVRPAGSRLRNSGSKSGSKSGNKSGHKSGNKSGYVLPSAAAATLVLTATGAHFGGAIGASAEAASGATAMLAASGAATADPIVRDVSDRAARGASRSEASAVSAAEADAATGGSGGTDAAPDGEADRLDTQAAADTAERTQAKVDAQALEKDKAAADAAAQAQVKADAEAKAQAADDAAKAASDAAHAWVAPINTDYQLTSGFGMRWGAMHPGQDFAISVGTPVKALSSGTVIFAGWEGGYGNKIEIQYWDGTVSWFAHNSKLLVGKGENVTPGETVSLSGNTGHSTGPHLHVEIHPNNGGAIPPIPWLTAKGIMP